MIRSVTVRSEEVPSREDVVILPLAKGTKKLEGAARALDRACKSLVSHHLQKGIFSAGMGETMLLALRFPKTPFHLLLLGVGERDKLTPEVVAEVGAAAARSLSKHNFKSAALMAGSSLPDAADGRSMRAFVKGFSLAQYEFSLAEKPAKPPALRRLAVLADANRGALSRSAREGRVVAEYVAAVRDLVNTPANLLTPSDLARKAVSAAKEHGVTCRVIGRAEMAKQGMGAILSVARGSREEPRLIVMEYNKAHKNLPLVCLVGKGVTFDSGGISLKHWDKMHMMKGDMSGAAVVINATTAAASLDIPVRIATVVPVVENMPDGTALRPGDVVTTYSGKTVEVLTTDAEGRLILADALTYVQKHFDPMVTVDFASLTGAVQVALGTRIAGVMGNDQTQVDRLIAAGRKVGEAAWQLPLDDYFYKSVKGTISDYKNYSGRDGSTITAAALLGEFAGDDPWVHVDIAGTFWKEPGGATGYGLDLALQYLQDIAGNS